MQVTLDAHYGFAPAIVRALVHSLWQVALLAFLAAVSFALLRRRSAGLRHAAGMLYLLAMTVAPLVTFALCWRVPAMSLKVGARASATAPPATGLGAVLDLNQSWSDWIPLGVTLVWTLGVALMLLRQIGGWQFIRRLQQQPYSELSPAWHKRVQVLRLALGISRVVTVRLADHVVSPFTAHFLRPLIWLPVSLLTQLPPEQIEALLAHELAHIRRLDWLWNGMQCVVEAMLFYHPGMWWLSRRIRQERELACDDLAVAVCGDPIALAEALAALEHQRLPNSRFVLAAQGGSLMKRITHLLSSQPAHQSWRVPGALLALLCSGTLCAAQIDSSTQFLTHLKFQSTIDSSGTVREITAEGLDRQRYYRASTDSQGHTTEIYQEDGRPKPIDSRVRLWLDQVSRRSVAPSPVPSPSAAAAAAALAGIVARPAAPPPAPTAPAAPAAPPTPDALVSPALPPVPPMPPSIASADEFSGLLSSLNTDRRLVAITGSPAVVEPDTFRGRFDTGAASGFNLVDGAAPRAARADFVLIFSGPKGRAVVQYAGKVQDGSWHVSKLSFQPAGTRAKAGASVVADMQTEISEEAAAHAREQAEEAVAQAAEQAREQANAAEEAGREAKQRVAEAVAQAKEQAAEAEQEGKQAIQQAKEAVAQAQEQAMEAAQESQQAAQQAKQEVAQAQAQAAEAEQEGKQAMQQAKREVAQAQEQAARAAQAGERERQRGADAVARAEVQVAQAQKLAQAAMQRAHDAAVRALQHPVDSAAAADTEQ